MGPDNFDIFLDFIDCLEFFSLIFFFLSFFMFGFEYFFYIFNFLKLPREGYN